MEYNYKSLLREDCLDNRTFVLTNVNLSENREQICDELIEWKYVDELNRIIIENKSNTFSEDRERINLLQQQISN